MKGVVDGDSLEATALDGRLVLWQGDISTLKVDAIVNACNSALLGCFIPNHNCIDNVEHSMAGVQMRYACFRQMQERAMKKLPANVRLRRAIIFRQNMYSIPLDRSCREN